MLMWNHWGECSLINIWTDHSASYKTEMSFEEKHVSLAMQTSRSLGFIDESTNCTIK